jgi:hypothetical protein
VAGHRLDAAVDAPGGAIGELTPGARAAPIGAIDTNDRRSQ